MTTAERTALQNFVNKYSEIEERENHFFEELQLLNHSSGDGSRWCSGMANMEGVLKTHPENYTAVSRAETCIGELYKEYGKRELMQELMSTLAELDFWK